MLTANRIKITNAQRQEQRNNKKLKQNHQFFTPPKSVLKKYVWRKVWHQAQKLGYELQYSFQLNNFPPDYHCRPAKYMAQDFEHKVYTYYGGNKFNTPKVLKNKDKYEMNLEIGKTFKKNPLVKIFSQVQNKYKKWQKLVAFEAIKRCK